MSGLRDSYGQRGKPRYHGLSVLRAPGLILPGAFIVRRNLRFFG